jgi:peptide/nickel transport system substrate-binding protein
VDALPRAVYFPGQATFEYSLMVNGWGSQTGEGSYILSTAFHTRDAEAGYGGFNHYHYSNPEVDAAIEAATTELDAETRRGLLEQAMTAAVTDLAAIPLVNLRLTWAGRSDVLEFTPRVDQETQAIRAVPAE